MGNFTFLAILMSSIVMILGIILAPFLLSLSGAQGNIFQMGVSYLRIIFLGSIFVNFMQGANMIIRAEGRMKTAMSIMAAGAILNIILDPILIILFPKSGAQAVAIATIISQAIQASATLIYFLKLSPVVKFNGIKPAKELNSQIFSVGISAMLMQIINDYSI